MRIPVHGPSRTQRYHTVDQMICAVLTAADAASSVQQEVPLCVSDAGVISCRDGARRIAAVADYLQVTGVTRRGRVAVLATRDLQLPIWVAGIIHAGAAYCPIDIHQPLSRVEYQLRTLAPQLVVMLGAIDQSLAESVVTIAQSIGTSAIEGAKVDFATEEREDHSLAPNLEISPVDPCYISFTSGSTGTPKAVVNNHVGVSGHLEWMGSVFGSGEGLRVLQKAPLGFDVGIAELLNPLANGGVIVMPDALWQPIDVEGLVRYIQHFDVSVMSIVPSLLRGIFEVLDDFGQPLGCLSSLQHLLLGGEAVPADIVARCRREIGCSVHGLYGPTEAAMDVAWIEYTDDTVLIEGQSLIGWPEANVSLYLRDRDGREITQPDTAGEICIAGVQVAEGYLGRRDLTDAVFVPSFHPTIDGGRMYCTGDIARWTAARADDDSSDEAPNLVLEYLGRIGDQVKIRGNRVELGEIESAMRQVPGIRDAAVVVVDSAGNSQRLVGFYCEMAELRDAGISTMSKEKLKDAIASALPSYMVPSQLVPLTAIPLTGNGKCDRMALRRLLEVN